MELALAPLETREQGCCISPSLLLSWSRIALSPFDTDCFINQASRLGIHICSGQRYKSAISQHRWQQWVHYTYQGI
jgi:hypothetical protein